MNDYPTRQEFNELREEVRQLREQRTEEIKAVRVEVASEDVINRLEKLEKALGAHSEAWLKTLQENFQESRADVLALRESQADFRDRLNVTATKDDLSKLETTMATKNDLSKLETTMATKNDLSKLETTMATKNDLSKLETTMATKNDLSKLETTMATKNDITALQTTQQRQEQLLQAILDRLPPKQ